MDFDESTIQRGERIVFLCGGKLGEALAHSPSVREAVLRRLPSRDQFPQARIILAERATEALPSSNFSNLLDLEEHISALVDGVILLVESAGSICELGSFVKVKEISDKLIIFLSNNHDNESSFIKLGPLKYFEELSKKEPDIYPYHWDFDNNGVVIQDYVIESIINDLNIWINKMKLRSSFDAERLGDRIFLTLSICHLLRGARMNEIKACYEAAGFERFSAEIVKHISILEICKLIKKVSHGQRLKYYVPLIQGMPLRFAFKDEVEDKDRNALRWIEEISRLIAEHDSTRMRIFQEHQHGG